MAQSSTSSIKVFIWLGVLALLILVSAPIVFGYITILKYQSAMESQQPFYNEPLGEMGSHCGGPSRLPCKPGMNCDYTATTAEGYGTCTATTGTTSGQTKVEPSGPHVVSVKIDGMQLTSTGYAAAEGTEATIRVQTQNATKVTMELSPTEGHGWAGVTQDLGTVKKSAGGVFTASLSVHYLDANIKITAKNDKGESSSVTVHVASIP